VSENPVIVRVEQDEQIVATRDVLRQLRPNLPGDEKDYLAVVRSIMASDGYRLVAVVEEGTVRAVAGYRLFRMLYCGRILSVDDLVTDERVRSRSHGARLLTWLKAEGRATECAELHLISRVTREAAHRFYFREGLQSDCYHFRAILS
jgi:GNAT superfamily N-acetyltransferase